MHCSSPNSLTERKNERVQKGISRRKREEDTSPPAAEIRSFRNEALHPIDSNPECQGLCDAQSGLRGIHQTFDIASPSASSEFCISKDGREPDPRGHRTGGPSHENSMVALDGESGLVLRARHR